MVKHFIKTLLLFTAMIFIGLLGVYLLSYFDKSDEPVKSPGDINIPK